VTLDGEATHRDFIPFALKLGNVCGEILGQKAKEEINPNNNAKFPTQLNVPILLVLRGPLLFWNDEDTKMI